MNMQLRFISGIGAWLALATAGYAHHSAAQFDSQAEFTTQATVVDWRWANPHCLIKFTVKGEGNKPARDWVAETSNPIGMASRGWVRDQFKPGDQITITVRPSRDGAATGQVVRVVTPEGKTLTAYGRSEGAPAAAPATAP
jgi:hypothetical protein